MVAAAIIYPPASHGSNTVAELRKLIDDGQEIAILDVRPREIRVQEGTIPGAVSAHPADTDPALKDYSRDKEIVVYCACPNEESAGNSGQKLDQYAGTGHLRHEISEVHDDRAGSTAMCWALSFAISRLRGDAFDTVPLRMAGGPSPCVTIVLLKLALRYSTASSSASLFWLPIENTKWALIP
jgi:rhodanese-related sulfurtransferase